MRNPYSLPVLVLGLLTMRLLGFAADEVEERAFIRELTERRPAAKTQIYGFLTLRLADNQRREVPVKTITEPSPEYWVTRWETQSAEGAPAERLTVSHQLGRTNIYEWSRLDRPDGSFQKLNCTNLFQPFVNSDFWLVDLGLEFFQWPQQKILRTEMRKGRSCRVLESINPSPTQGTYSRVVSWIDSEALQPIRVEVFDAQNKLLKVFAILGIKKVDGKVQLKDLEIRNEQSDTRTRLDLELEIDQ